MSNTFEKLGLAPIKPMKGTGKNSSVDAYFAFRKDKSGKKSVVINIKNEVLERAKWSLTDDRVSLSGNGSMLGLQPSLYGDYALIACGKDIAGKVSRYEIKVSWQPSICAEPSSTGNWPIKIQYLNDIGKDLIMFPIPTEAYKERAQ